MLSNNADPMYGLHLTQTTPIELPWIFRYLGKIKTEFQFAKLSGHQFPARPFFNLQKISFHPTENLELGFTRAQSGLEWAILLQHGHWQGTSDRLAIAASRPPIPMIPETVNQDSIFPTGFPGLEIG